MGRIIVEILDESLKPSMISTPLMWDNWNEKTNLKNSKRWFNALYDPSVEYGLEVQLLNKIIIETIIFIINDELKKSMNLSG